MIRAFRKSAARATVPRGAELIAAIERERPDMKGRLWIPPHTGMAQVVMSDNEVFKAPLMAAGVDDLNEEIKTQKTLFACGLPVPEVTTIGKNAAFFGMKRFVPGVALDDIYDELTEIEKRRLAKEVAQFIVGTACALKQQDGEYARNDDLHLANILIDPESKQLMFIDFGKMSYRSKFFLAHGLGGDNNRSHPFYDLVEHQYKDLNAVLDNNSLKIMGKICGVVKSLARSTFMSPKVNAP